MKNMKKLVALFAATVMTMSLSVSAFAATVETTVRNDGADITDNSFNLVFEAPTGGEADIDQMTMIAYLVPDTTTIETWVPYSNQPIVAINQIDGDDEFGSVPVDVTKLTAGHSIAVAIGGTDVGAADIYKALITYSTAPQIVSYAVTYELYGGTATGNPAESNSEETIADFFADVTAPSKDGFEFLHWSKTPNGEDAINTESPELMSTLLDDPAGTTVTLYAVYKQESGGVSVQYILGDIDGNGLVENADIVEFIVYGKTRTSDYAIGEKLGDTNYVLGDIDGNGLVENADIVEFIVYGKTRTSDYDIGQPLN